MVLDDGRRRKDLLCPLLGAALLELASSGRARTSAAPCRLRGADVPSEAWSSPPGPSLGGCTPRVTRDQAIHRYGCVATEVIGSTSEEECRAVIGADCYGLGNGVCVGRSNTIESMKSSGYGVENSPKLLNSTCLHIVVDDGQAIICRPPRSVIDTSPRPQPDVRAVGGRFGPCPEPRRRGDR